MKFQIRVRNQINALFISEWAYKLKIWFNPNLNDTAQEIIFSNKTLKPTNLVIHLVDSAVTCPNIQKLSLDDKFF